MTCPTAKLEIEYYSALMWNQKNEKLEKDNIIIPANIC